LTADDPKFIDPETNKAKPWDTESFMAFKDAVADKARKIYAQQLAADPSYSMDNAYVDAVDQLSSFVRAEPKRSTMAGLPLIGGMDFVSGGKQLVYRRGPTGNKERESEPATKAGPAAAATGAPKTADDYLKSIGAQ
jgi:hypothetical protein